jgi:hypothetical protein
MKHTEVEVRLHWPVSNTYSDNRATLEITDRRSGRRMFEAELLADDVAGILATRGAVVSAEVLGDMHYGLIGKYHVVERVEIPQELLEAARERPYDQRREPTPEMREWANLYLITYGWTEYDYRTNNSPRGWELIVHKYVDTREEED